ncbi:MAG: hypothetical protein A2151_03670 [Candidatus Muproteobacteria bacterium RBG_16_65_34]|uniref:Uncharacterized protein n=1 Tax=Candidatus Muproteobacteria bacterium RBG_16_65_34 TaxID=1817760 RepID=A0A1F6TN09_9PROT|nr:MAG: hypothetical protein A2151_03670 [Candidatus Muproteobacteria bacterium RBG_16_65_34]
MLGRFRKKKRSVGRGLIALMATLWLSVAISPCVMAQPMDGAAAHSQAAMQATDDCTPPAATECALPDLASPITAQAAPSDLAAVPVLLTTLPAAFARTDVAARLRPEYTIPAVPTTPLHIRHLVLLI